LLQRLPQLTQQPRVLDGDDGLSGEGCHQIDLLLAKWVHLLAGQRKDTYCRSFSQKRNTEDGPKSECLLIAGGSVLGIGQPVGDMDQLGVQGDSSNRALAAARCG